MNKLAITTFVLGVSLAAYKPALHADDTMNNAKTAVEHPETSMHEAEANSADKNTQIYDQQKKEAKARLDQAKKDYEASLKTNGADSSVTKDAKSRLKDAKSEYRKYAKKTAKAQQDLQEDTQKVKEDKATQ